jgi:hypothetical protein
MNIKNTSRVHPKTRLGYSLPLLRLAGRFIFVIASISACAANGQQPEQVVVGPLGASRTVTDTGMTREELEDHVRRFADRYSTRIALAANAVRDHPATSAEHKRLMHDWKTVSNAAIVDVAIGSNAVTNLLDMMALTRLSRLVVESYWIPEVFGEDIGAEFNQTFIDLEEDIWTVADDVLTTQQQEELIYLVDQWHAENPEQIYPWYVRLSNFSGQRAASLAAVQQTGGMLKEVARAREAAEEMQAFGERVLFYLQRAPMLTSNEFESGVSSILSGPEFSRMLDDSDRFVASIERLVDALVLLPEGRIAAVDQFMDRLAEERQALLQDLSATEPGLRDLLAELRPVLESIERTVTLAKTSDPQSKPFDINEYRALVAESTTAAAELRLLAQSVRELLAGASDATPLVDALVEAENTVADRVFLQLVALIVIFFIALLGYRFVAGRLFRSEYSSA